MYKEGWWVNPPACWQVNMYAESHTVTSSSGTQEITANTQPKATAYQYKD